MVSNSIVFEVKINSVTLGYSLITGGIQNLKADKLSSNCSTPDSLKNLNPNQFNQHFKNRIVNFLIDRIINKKERLPAKLETATGTFKTEEWVKIFQVLISKDKFFKLENHPDFRKSNWDSIRRKNTEL